MLKIALVKQDVLPDLYVCSKEEKSLHNILFSSINRVGPFGLIAELEADFYIVKEEYEKETQIHRKIDHSDTHILKTQTIDKLPRYSYRPLPTTYTHADFRVSCYDIDWEQYDIVISINISIPKKNSTSL